MRGVSREARARDAAWSLGDGNCKERTIEWTRWESTYAASPTAAARRAALVEPAALCAACPIATECADLAELSGYTGIAAGHGYRNGRLDHAHRRHPKRRRTA